MSRTGTPAIYLLDGNDIVNGIKQAIVTPTPRDIEGTRVLLVKAESGGKIAGIVTIGEPEELPITTFDEKQTIHNISPVDRRRWWPENETLFLYPITSFAPLVEEINIPLPAGSGMKTTISAWNPDMEYPTITSITQLASGKYLYTYGYQ